MNILYIAHRIPYPPNKGEKIRTFHQIQQLAKNHTIHLVSFVDEPDDIRYVPALRRHCASVEVICRSHAPPFFRAAAALLKRKPLSVSVFYRKALAKKIVDKLATEQLDCILVSSSSMAQYVSFVPHVRKILDFIDIDSEKWRLYADHRSFPLSLVYALEAERLAKYEEHMAHVFDHSILISERERRVLQGRVNGRAISVVSNGVDLEYFRACENGFVPASQPTIVFTGAMDYFPNVDAVRYFCHDIFPLVQRWAPNAQFYVVGRNPTRQVRELKKQTNVIVTGTVPDVRPYLAQATISIAPFRIARGVQNKILESMAMGVPVVGTAEAFKGITATEEDGVRIVNDPCSFAQHVITFLQGDASLRREAGLQARRYVERHHRWEDQGARLERLLEEVVGGKTGAKSLEVKSAALA